MKAALKALFGGGSSYVYMAFLAGAVIFAVHYADIKGDLKTAKLERDAYKEQSESKDATIASQARSQARRSDSAQKLNTTEDAINALPQTTSCVSSPSVKSVIVSLHNEQNSRLAGDTK